MYVRMAKALNPALNLVYLLLKGLFVQKAARLHDPISEK
jgi:hypothetical protein